jgi:hypothetical protein
MLSLEPMTPAPMQQLARNEKLVEPMKRFALASSTPAKNSTNE